jgi:TrmH family RNA methyltransferase
LDTVFAGKHNPRFTDIRKALRQATLTSEGFLPVEGPKLVGEAAASGLEIAAVFTRTDAPVDIASIPLTAIRYSVEPAVFRTLQSTETSQGVIALVRPPRFVIEDVWARIADRGPVIVLAALQDPGNAGTILRVAESFGSAGCLALRGTVSPYNSKTVRASAGSLFRLPHVWNLDVEELATELRRNRIRIVGSSPRAAATIASWDWRNPTAVLIGNEGRGLDTVQQSHCDEMLRIPQQSHVESLNSAIAAAVILYEACRARGLQ